MIQDIESFRHCLTPHKHSRLVAVTLCVTMDVGIHVRSDAGPGAGALGLLMQRRWRRRRIKGKWDGIASYNLSQHLKSTAPRWKVGMTS